MRLLDTMSYKNNTEQEGKIETINERAQNRCIYHTVPKISRFVRSQNPTNLSKAVSKAIEKCAIRMSNN